MGRMGVRGLVVGFVLVVFVVLINNRIDNPINIQGPGPYHDYVLHHPARDVQGPNGDR